MVAFSYTYKVPGIQKTPAEIAGAICQGLAESEAGLTPASLLDASRDESAPLHKEFEWRDDVAAEKYRLNQARGLIQNLRITVESSETEVQERSFVSIPGGKSAYVSLESSLTNAVWREHLLKQASTDAEVFRAKYSRLTELANVIKAIDGFISK